jgi:predicted metal-dependent HD superfamily phosphohydrolase
MPGRDPCQTRGVSGEGVDSARRLALRWPLDEGYDVRDHLLAAYADPRRGYHDLRHLEEVLDHLDLLLAEVSASERAEVDATLRLAAWFHDAVYSGAPDDEERSARLAEESLAATHLDGDAVAEVARLVRLTATHDPADGDLAGALLSDADLAVLAAGPERYAAYVTGVRREYSHVPDEAFRRGRAEVLRALLAAPTLFRTAPGRRLWERDARANVEAELAALGS